MEYRNLADIPPPLRNRLAILSDNAARNQDVEPDRFAPWKKLDKRLYQRGHRHLFELMGIHRAAQAIDLLRRFAAFTSLAKIDDLLDEVRSTSILKRILLGLGIP